MLANLNAWLNEWSNLVVVVGGVVGFVVWLGRSVHSAVKLAETLEEHGKRIDALASTLAEHREEWGAYTDRMESLEGDMKSIQKMLVPNGKNTTNPGDLLAIILDEVRELKAK